MIDKDGTGALMPGMGDIADRLFGTGSEDATPLCDDDEEEEVAPQKKQKKSPSK